MKLNDPRKMKFRYQEPEEPFIVPDVDATNPIVIEMNSKYGKMVARHWYLNRDTDDHRRTKKGVSIPVGDMLPFLVDMIRLYNETVPRDQAMALCEIEMLEDLEEDADVPDPNNWWGTWSSYGEEE